MKSKISKKQKVFFVATIILFAIPWLLGWAINNVIIAAIGYGILVESSAYIVIDALFYQNRLKSRPNP